MLMLNAAGKSSSESLELVRNELKDDESEIKISIDGPAQFDQIKKFLEAQNFDNIFLEDDDGILYLNAVRASEQKIIPAPAPEPEPAPVPVPVSVTAPTPAPVVKNTTGILISCENGKQKTSFLKKFIASLVKAKIKPDVIALINSAVKLAAYDSQTCEYLKKLEADGVQILISESCADKIGMTEAAGVGVIVDMSEIFEEIFSCDKIFSV